MMHPTRIEAMAVLLVLIVSGTALLSAPSRAPAAAPAGNVRASAVTIVIANVTPWNGQTIGSATPTIVALYVDTTLGATVVGVNFVLDGMNLTSAARFNQTVFALPLALDLRNGPHFASLTVFDNLGGTGSASWSFTVDTIPPVLIVAEPVYPIVPTRGVLVAGTAVLVDNVTFRGAEPINVTATVLPLGVTNWTEPAANGSFALGVPLSEGVNTIFVNATDHVGNFATVIKSIVRDTTKPMLRVFTPTSQVSPTSTVWVSGQTEPGAFVVVNGYSVAVNPLDGTWGVNLTLPDGINIITIAAADQVGNLNYTGLGILVDSDAPRVVLRSPTATLTDRAQVVVSGTATDTQLVALLVNGNPVAFGADGAFSTTLTLPEGLDPVVVVAVDAAQHVTTVQTQIRVDTTPPAVVVDFPPDGLETNSSTVVVRGTVDDANATVLVNGVMVRPGAAGAWQTTVALLPGGNTITVSAVDAAGNVAAPVVLHVEYFSPVPNLENGTAANAQSLDEQGAVLRFSLLGVVLLLVGITFVLYSRTSRRLREDRRAIAELARRMGVRPKPPEAEEPPRKDR